MVDLTGSGALDGLTVLDLTRVFAGPFATQLLGDLGADVIKVERPGRGDECRDYGVDEGEPRPGAPFLAHNRNKRSIVLDLKSELGAATLLDLTADADVLIHNFRPGVMERLGLDYPAVARRNPRLVYASISGFGAAGSLSRRAANDLSIQSYSGLLSITGQPGGPPARNPTSVCDLTAGLYAVIGILAALAERERTGLGQEVTTSMLEGQLTYLNHFLTDYWMTGRAPQKWGTANRLGIPNEAFPTSDGWVCITSANEEMWRRCAVGLGIAWAADDPRFVTLKDRYAHRSELVETVSAATAALSSAEVLSRMAEAGVPCVPVNEIPDIASDPLLTELDAYVDLPVGDGRTARLVNIPLRFSRSGIKEHRRPPELGEHTDEILKAAGYTPARIAELKKSGAVS